jgi:hypothetical protein
MSDFRSGDRVRDDAGQTGTVVDLTDVADGATPDDPGATRTAVLVRLDAGDHVVGYREHELTKVDDSA